ncbi:MAG: hypothetical protein US31_C0002G0063 [Berkelbacteria bacterium GW2011_GWA1_36_9]|uniref:Glycoside hydrolase family 5 domain-containing protein n=1 Tax=Berkelbacteria bacterium GW2011_GWA1_36_9 TaxID=1618331 RepID=A0A0G0FI50_9BACT|nr:MAG: hypothetical protein US31_C0002G0063 [Berkelbacteria bacterium GW2011_GWA1_36_9]
MKKFLIVFFALVLGTTGGYFTYKYVINKDDSGKSFMWGVTMGPSDLNNYSKSVWSKQAKVAKELGVGWIRLRFDSENIDPFKRNDEEISVLESYGLQTVLIIEQDIRNKGGDNYKDGYKDGSTIAGHYKGKIKYYQMINEGGGETIKAPTMNGQDEDQFDEVKYKSLTDYLRGVSEGITSADPDAKKIVNMGWTHVGYLDKLIKDNISFDMIGIDWYGWMGPIGEKKLENGQLLIDRLKSYNKPLIFMEVNADSDGRTVHEDKQVEFISLMGKWAYENRSFISGFFVLSLFDGINNPNDNAEYFGIVQAKKSSGGTMIPGDPRKSYYTYQEMIKKYTK